MSVIAKIAAGTESHQTTEFPSVGVGSARAGASGAHDIATIITSLGLDRTAIAAAHALNLPAEQLLLSENRRLLGVEVVALALSVQKMALIHHTPSASRTEADRAQQLEAVRKMLLAMVEDVRVVVIKLAERLVALRELALNPTMPEAQTAAQEVRDLFAPLANRLGIWQLKWELEDQSLRILEPAIYKQIARALDERKADRDAYIEEVKSRLTAEICAAGIEASIAGRAKHITSIWNKMRRKGYQIDELYDIRGVRVLVDDVRACYTVLGLVHNLWTPIPSEFDDYIARPKANNYRSLHTAVVGPNGNALEVQIRTHDMHRASEFGVAAHWRYKEGAFTGANANAGSNASSGKRDGDFEEKLAWLRQVMDWRESVAGDGAGAGSGEAAEALKTNLFEESIFVFTPQGRVIDLPKDATAIDFAYHVHSDLGHRCRGARVDGMMVPLNTPLKNGQRIEVQTVKEGGPSRDWLNPELGFVRSARAKSKVRAWFNALQQDETLAQGRAELERFLQREGKTALSLDAIAKEAGVANLDALFNDIAKARINQKEIVELIHKAAGEAQTAPQVVEEPILRKARSGGDSGILIVGMDKLLTGLAKCCRPAPPDTITGFITKGAGISVHRLQCSNAQRLTKTQPERMIQAEWGSAQTSVFPVGIEVIAIDRQGLLRDVSEVLSKERINVTAVNTHSKDMRAKMRFNGEIKDVDQLRKAISAVLEVKGVLEARRV
jgi:GTP pyrophosphokinase